MNEKAVHILIVSNPNILWLSHLQFIMKTNHRRNSAGILPCMCHPQKSLPKNS